MTEPRLSADTVRVEDLAKLAWYADDEEGDSPSEYWWDCSRDIWIGGYEAGYRAALAAQHSDGHE